MHGVNKPPVSTSTDWEAQGYDRAYEGPASSDNGPFPLVMLVAGSGAETWEYLYIGTRLASHGFVVAITDHDRDGQWPWSFADNTELAMFNRGRDVPFAITELLLKNDTIGEPLHGLIEPSKIAMSGHSLGGYATYALAGGDDQVCDALAPVIYGWESLPYPQSTCAPTDADFRIRAIVSLDGFSPVMHYYELARISVPSLIIGETVEHMLSYNPMWLPTKPDFGLWNARPHAAINRYDSYRVDVTIADHVSFATYCDAIELVSRLGVNASAAGFDATVWGCVARGTLTQRIIPSRIKS